MPLLASPFVGSATDDVGPQHLHVVGVLGCGEHRTGGSVDAVYGVLVLMETVGAALFPWWQGYGPMNAPERTRIATPYGRRGRSRQRTLEEAEERREGCVFRTRARKRPAELEHPTSRCGIASAATPDSRRRRTATPCASRPRSRRRFERGRIRPNRNRQDRSVAPRMTGSVAPSQPGSLQQVPVSHQPQSLRSSPESP